MVFDLPMPHVLVSGKLCVYYLATNEWLVDIFSVYEINIFLKQQPKTV